MASPKWVVVDDTDTEIVYNGPWSLDRGSQDSAGNFGPAYLSTLHGTKADAGLSYAFTGSKVKLFGTTNIRNDSGVIDPAWGCFIDGISIGGTTPFQYPENNWVFCEQNVLADGPHILTLNATVKNQQTFWFDTIHYVPSPSVPLDTKTILVDHVEPSLQFGPGWVPLGDTANMTSQTGSTFTYDFVGISLSWIGFIPNELPLAATSALYTIDGGTPVNFLLSGLRPGVPTEYNVKFFETPQLTPGPHKLVVTHLGNSATTPLTMDYLLIQNGSIPVSSTPNPSSNRNSSSGTPPTGSTNTNKGADAVHDSAKSNIEVIVGGVIGGVALLGLFAIAAFLLYRKYRKGDDETVSYGKPSFSDNPTPSLFSSLSPTQPVSPQHLVSPGWYGGGQVNRPISQTNFSEPTSPDHLQPFPSKLARESMALAGLVPQRSGNPGSSASSEVSSSNIVSHVDSGVRLSMVPVPPAALPPQTTVELPPVYTAG